MFCIDDIDFVLVLIILLLVFGIILYYFGAASTAIIGGAITTTQNFTPEKNGGITSIYTDEPYSNCGLFGCEEEDYIFNTPTGGKNTRKGEIIVEDNARFVFDGHNLIHQYSGKSAISLEEFERNLKEISRIITKAMPGKQLHIVLKNPGEALTKLFNEKYGEQLLNKTAEKKTVDKKKTIKKSLKQRQPKETKIPYFKQLVEISKDYPTITYHLAYGKEPVNTSSSELRHYLRGRDDILAIYLSKPDGYIITMDNFRDFKDFNKVRPFKHFSVQNGEVLPKEDILPQSIMQYIKSPNLGNHIKYQFKTHDELRKLGIRNGAVYLNDELSRFSHLYLATD